MSKTTPSASLTTIRSFGKTNLVFVRKCNHHDIPQTGMIYLHHWGSGYQQLVFQSDEEAAKWWKAELTLQQENRSN